jgi:hypothetical protein
MNIYHVHGIRHQALAFAETASEAVAQALASGEVGDWEAPVALEISLPPATRCVQTGRASSG